MRGQWHPPRFVFTALTLLVILLAIVAVAITSAHLWTFVANGELPPPAPVGIWLLYAATAVTGVKALMDWLREGEE